MRLPLVLAASTAAAAVLLISNDELPSHADCALFTEKGAAMRRHASLSNTRDGYLQSKLTAQVTGLLASTNRIIRSSDPMTYGQWLQVNPITSIVESANEDRLYILPSVPGRLKSGAGAPTSIVNPIM